nr:hypothetical protein [Thalassotalea sp. LPB0316]
MANNSWVKSTLCLAMSLLAFNALATSDTTRPNILIIWGDDIGIGNISAYSDGIMGYQHQILIA